MILKVKNIYAQYKVLLGRRDFIASLISSFLLLGLSIWISLCAGAYVSNYSGHIVPDLILDHIPVVDVGFIFFQGAFIFVLILSAILLCIPRAIPFAILTTGLFFIIRSIFMVMTHLSAPLITYYNYIDYEHHAKEIVFTLSSGNDLFFSGHAGFPFLLGLIFWKYKHIRYFFIAASIISSVAVLFGHLHYSIDVFSAFFITYGVFQISKHIFRKEFLFFTSKIIPTSSTPGTHN